MSTDVRPFPWRLLASVRRRDLAVMRALAGRWPALRWRADEPVGFAPVRARLLDLRVAAGPELARRAAEPTAMVMRLVGPGRRCALLIVPGRLAVDCAQRILSGQAPLWPAPRAPSRAEQGVCALAAAVVLDQAGLADIAVELVAQSAASSLAQLEEDRVVAVELAVSVAGATGTVRVICPEAIALAAPAAPARPLSTLAKAAPWLDSEWIAAAVVSGVGSLTARQIASLKARDVVVFGRPANPTRALIWMGRGAFPATLAADRVTIAGPYEVMSTLNDALVDDLSVLVRCQLGEVRMTLREALELAPGQVLALARPLGDSVVLVAGDRVLGRGELVDIDGELGVRVIDVGGGSSQVEPARDDSGR
jgi:flagellar motor switch/type III secretory pathway protein FliN